MFGKRAVKTQEKKNTQTKTKNHSLIKFRNSPQIRMKMNTMILYGIVFPTKQNENKNKI